MHRVLLVLIFKVCGIFCQAENVCGNITCSSNSVHCSIDNGCLCIIGFVGTRCEIDVDECTRAHRPLCGTTGHCENTVGSWQCLVGWYGSHCRQRNVSIAVVDCLPGWTGGMCDTDINECQNKTLCPGVHSVCENSPGQYNCSCESGWTGNECRQDVNECENNPCENGSTCHNNLGNYECKYDDITTFETATTRNTDKNVQQLSNTDEDTSSNLDLIVGLVAASLLVVSVIVISVVIIKRILRKSRKIADTESGTGENGTDEDGHHNTPTVTKYHRRETQEIVVRTNDTFS